jgi:hypothetical protein
MYSKAIQHLASLEVLLETPLHFRLPHNDGGTLTPWFWDNTNDGAFNLLALAQREGWMQWTDSEVAIETWQFSEQRGLAAPGILENDPSCIEDDDANILLSEADRDRRAQVYDDLLAWFNQNLQKQQTFLMRCSSDYTWVVVVGQQANGRWLAIAPTVPNETPCYVTDSNSHDENRDDYRDIIIKSKVEPRIAEPLSDSTLAALLEQLPGIKIYGWYDGGYNITHNYQLHTAVADSQEEAIADIFLRSGFLEQYHFQTLAPGEQLYDGSDKTSKIAIDRFAGFNRFLSEVMPEIQLYCFCFWDREFLYFVTDEQLYSMGDRVGFSLRSQFTYNP